MTQPTPFESADLGPIAEIIGREPHGIVRWGITVLLASIAGLLGMAWMIHYPDVVHAPVTITSTHPPVKVVAQSAGKIERLLVAEGDLVAPGQELALLESATDLRDWRYLVDRLKNLHSEQQQGLAPNLQTWRTDLELGDLQLAYNEWLIRCQEHQNYTTQDHARQVRNISQRQFQHYRALEQDYLNQVSLLSREEALAAESFTKAQALFRQKLISESDLQSAEVALLQKQLALQSASSNLANHRIRKADLTQKSLDLDQEHQRTLQSQTFGILKAYKNLRNEMDRWERRTLLKAPIAGRVSFYQFWSTGQYVRQGDEVFTLVPEQGNLLAKLYLPQSGAGKAAPGQRVNIKLDGFPHREYGTVLGKITEISPVAEGGSYLINIQLETGLQTTYGKHLDIKFNMAGTAEIITQDMRLLHRLVTPFRYLSQSQQPGDPP